MLKQVISWCIFLIFNTLKKPENAEKWCDNVLLRAGTGSLLSSPLSVLTYELNFKDSLEQAGLVCYYCTSRLTTTRQLFLGCRGSLSIIMPSITITNNQS